MEKERDRKEREERKIKNKERQPSSTGQRASKRQKLIKGEYKEKEKTSKKKDKPTIDKKGKRKEGDDDEKEQGENEKTFQQEGKRKKDLTEMEKWIQERDEIDERRWSSFPNYEERAREIKRNIQKEKKKNREGRLERARKEEKTGEMIRLCGEFLDEHCETWQQVARRESYLRRKRG